MKQLVFVALAAAALAAPPALAQHGGHGAPAAASQSSDDMLASSSPANGAVLAEAPRTLALTFAHPVVLQTVAITGPDDAPVRATFRRPGSPTATYAVALPQLAAGRYRARWTASGHGHAMAGEVSFTIEQP
ncbi:MAG: copper resistance protein CopC [Hyphomonadaceae bacterium]|nr:copper resistance protein CopC [Hyphomonadaceae bacterium]